MKALLIVLFSFPEVEREVSLKRFLKVLPFFGPNTRRGWHQAPGGVLNVIKKLEK
jgi:hypothetical protein